MWLKRIQLGLLHTAVAVTLVPFTGALNRIMIHELGFAKTLVTILVALPYFFSPIQVAIGSFADHTPIAGRRRTPYIIAGILLCVLGTFIAPRTAFALVDGGLLDYALAFLAFGAWGMGYNLAAVSYLSLASEIDPKGRSRTIAIMFLLMVLGIIATAVSVGRMIDPYTPDALVRAFGVVGGVALGLALLGALGLEPRFEEARASTEERYTWGQMYRAVVENPQARLFFWYLILLLAAILGQDVLLEPYGAAAFDLSQRATTTNINSIWGSSMLVTLVVAGALQNRFSKKTVARWGAWLAIGGFVLIAGSGLIGLAAVFYVGVTLLGLGTGLATVSNLSLMLDMTTAQNVGLYIGAWGMANAIARLVGQLLSAIVGDVLTVLLDSNVWPYLIVFILEAGFLVISLLMLRVVNADAFQKQTRTPPSLVESAAMMSEASG